MITKLTCGDYTLTHIKFVCRCGETLVECRCDREKRTTTVDRKCGKCKCAKGKLRTAKEAIKQTAVVLAIGLAVMLFASSASGQTTPQCATVDECNALVTRLSQALQKTLDVNAANEKLVTAQKAQIDAQEQLIKVKQVTVEQQEKLLDYYRKATCDRTSFLFGLVKTTRCRL